MNPVVVGIIFTTTRNGLKMFIDYKNMSDEDIDSKIEELNKKIYMASTMEQEQVVQQLQFHLEILRGEMMERTEKMRFDLIAEKTPQSYIIGEDDAPTD